jgi:L-ascorbate metabolism protein UlaG (beta-lactamase superfamily)
MHPSSFISSILLIATLNADVCLGDDPETGRATYIANEGVMVELGQTRVLFDPLFRYPHDYYQAIPAEMEQSIIAGSGIFEGIDAVFISHYHADHFSPEMILQLMRSQNKVALFAPGQAVSALYRVAGPDDQESFARITSLDLAYGDSPKLIEFDDITVEAVLIPHSGWPKVHQNVENLSFRVTLENDLTVVHMGDADPNKRHFSDHEEYWSKRKTDAAFPPYWFFLAPGGRDILDHYIKPARVVGTHIPADPSNRDAELAGFDIFTQPGETRELEK